MCLFQAWTKRNRRHDTVRKKKSVVAILLKIAIAQGTVAVLDGRNYVRLYENVWFVSV